MPDPIPMIILAAVLILAIGSIGYLTLRRWKTSRTPTPQVPPEVTNEQWLQREAKNAQRQPFSNNS